jgi:hypothetical protein
MLELGLLLPKIKKVRVKKDKPLLDMINVKRSERLKAKYVKVSDRM